MSILLKLSKAISMKNKIKVLKKFREIIFGSLILIYLKLQFFHPFCKKFIYLIWKIYTNIILILNVLDLIIMN